MRTTLRLDLSVTQTLPPPTAMPRPSAPVGIRLTTRPRTASILVTLRSSALVTQTAPSPTASGGRRHADRNRLYLAVRLRVDPRHGAVQEFATQTAPAPTAIPLGSPPTSMRWTTRIRLGVDARDGAVQRVRHPDRPFADRNARRAVADRDLGHEPIRLRVDRRNRVRRSRASPGRRRPRARSRRRRSPPPGEGSVRRSRSGRRFGGEP